MADINKNNETDFSFDDDNSFYDKYKNDETLGENGKNIIKKIESQNQKILKNIFEWLDVVVVSVIAVVIIFTFVFRVVAIDGNSMLDTLHNAERVVISDLFYKPQRGDIVVISRNTDNSANVENYEKPIIKRVIATEGETVDIDFQKGIVYVDGAALDEPYAKEPINRMGDIEFPVRVKENCVFVLGDNRNDSLDSRFSVIGDNGMVNEKYILGKAVFRVFPFNKIGGLYKNN